MVNVGVWSCLDFTKNTDFQYQKAPEAWFLVSKSVPICLHNLSLVAYSTCYLQHWIEIHFHEVIDDAIYLFKKKTLVNPFRFLVSIVGVSSHMYFLQEMDLLV